MKGRTIDFQPVCPATEMTLPRATVLCAAQRAGGEEGDLAYCEQLALRLYANVEIICNPLYVPMDLCNGSFVPWDCVVCGERVWAIH